MTNLFILRKENIIFCDDDGITQVQGKIDADGRSIKWAEYSGLGVWNKRVTSFRNLIKRNLNTKRQTR